VLKIRKHKTTSFGEVVLLLLLKQTRGLVLEPRVFNKKFLINFIDVKNHSVWSGFLVLFAGGGLRRRRSWVV